MEPSLAKPRLTSFQDLRIVVGELRKLGVPDLQVYRQITEVGHVDLDMLNEVLRADRLAH